MNITNLEQSKLLKEWGYTESADWYWVKQGNWDKEKLWNTTEMSEFQTGQWEFDPIPSYGLEELIEFLGNKFFRLDRDEQGVYYVYTYSGQVGIGHIPIESLFNLIEYIYNKKV